MLNRNIGMYSALINIGCVAAFSLCMAIGAVFGSYLASMFIAFSFVPLMCTFCAYSAPENRVAGYTSTIFAGMYAVIILLVYFAQVTAVRLDALSEQALLILDYSNFGLFFHYDLLGYGMMALSTFFAGLTITPNTKADRWLKRLLMIHGVFFFSCLLLPMLGLFRAGMQGADWIGTAALEVWCAFFIPVGILSFSHFRRKA